MNNKQVSKLLELNIVYKSIMMSVLNPIHMHTYVPMMSSSNEYNQLDSDRMRNFL